MPKLRPFNSLVYPEHLHDPQKGTVGNKGELLTYPDFIEFQIVKSNGANLKEFEAGASKNLSEAIGALEEIDSNIEIIEEKDYA